MVPKFVLLFLAVLKLLKTSTEVSFALRRSFRVDTSRIDWATKLGKMTEVIRCLLTATASCSSC
jgi:hypothetical protein